MTTMLRGAEATLEAIEDLAAAGLSAQELFEEAAPRINAVVPSDGYYLGATDPETTLSMGAGVVHDLPPELCKPTWDYEFLVPDYVKFADIARGPRAVADIHDATGGRPERSARWRDYAPASGFRSEVRSAFTAGGAMWGLAQFNRGGDSPRYSDAEKAWLERVAPVLARGLRQALVAQPANEPAVRGPGVVLIDGAGGVVSATPEASAWLDELNTAMPLVGDPAFPLPLEAHAYVARVRSHAAEAALLSRTRLRTQSGVWLLMHASVFQGTDQLALVIEPAKASDVAPLIVEAYGLTQRELEVTRAIARGLSTAEIAGQLFLSPHTVRDHVKAIFEKVGVSSRGELVARVFADHYSPAPHIDPEPAS